jgi:tryptophan halogenase
MPINSICIVGGGTSGWLTACYIKKNLPEIQLTLVESSQIGTIGVGEGTQPYTTKFLRDCGLQPSDWMKTSDATYKLGVEFIGWQNHPFFVDNDSVLTHTVSYNRLIHNYWVGKHPENYYNWLPAYRLAKANISPKYNKELDFVIGTSNQSSEAVHFNAFKIVDTLKKQVLDKITYHDSEVIDVKINDFGVEHIVLTDRKIISDLYIDCTGFKSLLIEKYLKVQHRDINSLLPCDRAMAMPTYYNEPELECHPYTKATAMNSGWRWTIPTYGRIGNGYVYSSSFINQDQAELEFRTSLNDFKTDILHIKMRTGYKEKICYKNVIAVGLSGGFVEPLEATGITFTTKTVEMLVSYLKNSNFEFDDTVKNSINYMYESLFREILSFIHIHYKTNSKQDSEFWSYFNDVPMPEFIKEILRNFIPHPPEQLFKENNFSMFHSGQWFQVLNACGQYENVNSLITETPYYDIHIETFRNKIDSIIKKFPNHYELLQKLYSD